MLQDYFEVQTNVPVGDAPRSADILLLRRTTDEPTPFRGLWRNLTTWNVLEFKGPSVSARLNDLNLLIELGLGIHRRLNEERRLIHRTIVEPSQTSFWYVVRSLGARFLAGARQRLGPLEEIEPGIWRSQILQHLIFLVSSEKLASEPDSVPLHLLIERPQEKERELAQLVIEQPHYLEWYGRWLGTIHPQIWREIREMVATKHKGLKLDFSAIKDDIDGENIGELVESLGFERVMDAIGPKRMIEVMGVDWLVSKLSPGDIKKLKERLK